MNCLQGSSQNRDLGVHMKNFLATVLFFSLATLTARAEMAAPETMEMRSMMCRQDMRMSGKGLREAMLMRDDSGYTLTVNQTPSMGAMMTSTTMATSMECKMDASMVCFCTDNEGTTLAVSMVKESFIPSLDSKKVSTTNLMMTLTRPDGTTENMTFAKNQCEMFDPANP